MILARQGEAAERFGKAKLAILLMFINLLLPVLIVILSLIFAEDIWRYTVCIGREEVFQTDLDNLLAERGTEVWDYGRCIITLHFTYYMDMLHVTVTYYTCYTCYK